MSSFDTFEAALGCVVGGVHNDQQGGRRNADFAFRFRKLAFGAVALIAAVAPSITATAQPVPVTKDWITLRPAGAEFRILVPPDWEQLVPRGPSVTLSFRSSRSRDGKRPGSASCSVVSQPRPETANTTQAEQDAKFSTGLVPHELIDGLVSGLRDAVVHASRIVQVANHPAYFVVVSGRRANMEVGVQNVTTSVTMPRPGRLYSIACVASYTTFEGAEAAWSGWQPIIMAILGTLVFEDRECHRRGRIDALNDGRQLRPDECTL
jgi:hypothetical protein